MPPRIGHADASVDPTRDHDPAPESPGADRQAARQLLGAIFIAAGIVHLTHRRFYRSMAPYWLAHARREIDVATGTAQVFGGVVLFVPKLRNVARWVNLAVLAPAVPAVIGEVRRPYRLRPYTREWPGVKPAGPLALAPGHAGLAALLWWATRQDCAVEQPTIARQDT
jgi:uncharacterized membrane protein